MLFRLTLVALSAALLAACMAPTSKAIYDPAHFIPNPPHASERYTTDRYQRELSPGERYHGDLDF